MYCLCNFSVILLNHAELNSQETPYLADDDISSGFLSSPFNPLHFVYHLHFPPLPARIFSCFIKNHNMLLMSSNHNVS